MTTAVLGAVVLAGCGGGKTTISQTPPQTTQVTFPQGAATPSEVCGQCHAAIYQQMALGTEGDLKFLPITLRSASDPPLPIPTPFADTASAHHLAVNDPWPIAARNRENGGAACNTCHFPAPFSVPGMNDVEHDAVPRPADQQNVGVTCASCHLTPDGKIRGSYDPSQLQAPHETVFEPNMRSSVMCALCHSKGPRVVGKQTQTFYEWRDDYFNKGLGIQQCQDCHMPRDTRSIAEGWGVPRLVGQHVWPGGHSVTKIREGLTVSVQQAANSGGTSGTPLEVHVQNVGAAHSVPTGSNRRGIWMDATVIDNNGNTIASKEWLFAPWFASRPDDASFLTADQSLAYPFPQVPQIQADMQGPHETPVRAGEDRVLAWAPVLPSGSYTVQVVLTYDLNRYNDRSFTQDETELTRSSISILVP